MALPVDVIANPLARHNLIFDKKRFVGHETAPKHGQDNQITRAFNHDLPYLAKGQQWRQPAVAGDCHALSEIAY
jgi:hypothetical protein